MFFECTILYLQPQDEDGCETEGGLQCSSTHACLERRDGKSVPACWQYVRPPELHTARWVQNQLYYKGNASMQICDFFASGFEKCFVIYLGQFKEKRPCCWGPKTDLWFVFQGMTRITWSPGHMRIPLDPVNTVNLTKLHACNCTATAHWISFYRSSPDRWHKDAQESKWGRRPLHGAGFAAITSQVKLLLFILPSTVCKFKDLNLLIITCSYW